MSEIDDIISIAVGEIEDNIVTIEFKYRWVANRRGTAATRFYGKDNGFAVLQEYLSSYSVVTLEVGGKTYGMTWVADLIGRQTTDTTQTASLTSPAEPYSAITDEDIENNEQLKCAIKKQG